MKINLRGRRAYLYRRIWVPAGPDVPHAHPAEDYLGTISADAETIPPELLSLLTEAEQTQLREKILLPAAEARAAAAKRKSDPLWRIAAATQLLVEAAQFSQATPVPSAALSAAQRALEKVKPVDELPARAVATSIRTETDKLSDALASVKAAAAAVREGAYGKAPTEGARSTRPYRLWSALYRAVEGDERSLLRALQEKGYVKSRKG